MKNWLDAYTTTVSPNMSWLCHMNVGEILSASEYWPPDTIILRGQVRWAVATAATAAAAAAATAAAAAAAAHLPVDCGQLF